MEFKNISLSKIVPSATNPRSKNDLSGPEFNDLADSIKEKGVLVPILVRASADVYEIIAGMRRFMAAGKAGLTEIPAYIAVMNDAEAREAQIVENLQRKDIHPLEEGVAYRELLNNNLSYTVSDVAEHVGKSKTYVQDRLVLTGLIPAGQKEFREGEIGASVAALIARLSPAMQKKALDAWEKESSTKMREWIQEQIFADPKNAPWKNDEQMQAVLGGCEECSGKGGDLFGNKASEACTNPKCYAQRIKAFIAIKLKEEPELKQISSNYSYSQDKSQQGIPKGDYHEITSKKDSCEHAKKAIFVHGEKVGRMTKICIEKKCPKHGKSHAAYEETPEEKAKKREERKKEIAEKRATEQKNKETIAAALSKITWPMTEKNLDSLLVLCFEQFGISIIQPLVARHDIKAIVSEKDKYGYTRKDYQTPFIAWIKEGGLDRKLQTVFEFFMYSDWHMDDKIAILEDPAKRVEYDKEEDFGLDDEEDGDDE